MSTTPGGPRRRRIAGERRPRTVPATDLHPDTPPADPSPPVVEPSPRPQEHTAEPDREPYLEPDREPGATPRPGRTGWWGSRASLLVLGGLLALLLVLGGLAALGVLGTDSVAELNEAEATEQASRTASSAAEAAAAAILAYDHRSLEADKDAAVGFMTDEFAEEYSQTFEKVVAPTAEDTRAKVTASVLASGVIRASEDTARVLLFVDQATVSTAYDRPRIALNRVVMTMEREGDRWLVSDISPY